jgi:hypothetical protein
MKLPILPVALGAAIILGAGAGAGLRMFAPTQDRAGASPETVEDHSVKDQATASHAGGKPSAEEKKHEKKQAKAAKSESHGKKDDHGKAAPANFMKFSRQFVVPIMEQGEPKAMMILDVMIELDDGVGEGVYAEEPRLRDAVLRALLKQSSTGGFGRLFEEPGVLETTRAAILEETRAIIGDGAKSILIMDVGYQAY